MDVFKLSSSLFPRHSSEVSLPDIEGSYDAEYEEWKAHLEWNSHTVILKDFNGENGSFLAGNLVSSKTSCMNVPDPAIFGEQRRRPFVARIYCILKRFCHRIRRIY